MYCHQKISDHSNKAIATGDLVWKVNVTSHAVFTVMSGTVQIYNITVPKNENCFKYSFVLWWFYHTNSCAF